MSAKFWITGVLMVLLALPAKVCYAQTELSLPEQPSEIFDSTYIDDYTGLLTSRAFLMFQNASILINPQGGTMPKIVYHPNTNVRIGLAGFWKWFGLGLSVDNPFYKTDRKAYGRTTTLDMRVNAFGRSIAGELFLQQYKGFFASSPERIDGTHYIIPDMKSFAIGIAGYWIYNARRFSIRAAFIQNERQKRSAGSLVVRPGFLYYRLSSENGIIPPEVAIRYQIPDADLVSGGEFYSVSLAPGYVYTFVFLKNFYTTLALFPGIAAQFSSFSTVTGGRSEFEFAFQLGSRFALGYNSENWFVGGSVQTGFNEVPDKLNNAMFNYDVAQIRFWGGTRFDVFKKKKKIHNLHK